MIDEESEGLDTDLLKIIGLILLVVIVVIGGAILFMNYKSLKPYVEKCKDNPRLRYGEKCVDESDCISKCAEKLREANSI